MPNQPAESKKGVAPVDPASRQPKRRVAAKKPSQKIFTVRVRRTATVEEQVKVEALDRQAAEQAALEKAKHQPFDLKRADRAEEVLA